jgi:hypothetical protein
MLQARVSRIYIGFNFTGSLQKSVNKIYILFPIFTKYGDNMHVVPSMKKLLVSKFC